MSLRCGCIVRLGTSKPRCACGRWALRGSSLAEATGKHFAFVAKTCKRVARRNLPPINHAEQSLALVKVAKVVSVLASRAAVRRPAHSTFQGFWQGQNRREPSVDLTVKLLEHGGKHITNQER